MSNTQKKSLDFVSKFAPNTTHQQRKLADFVAAALHDAEVDYPAEEVRLAELDDKKRSDRFYVNGLMLEIVNNVNMLKAVEEVRKNAVLPFGADPKEVVRDCNELQAPAARDLLRNTLLCQEYVPAPTTHVRVPKGNGYYRHLSIASVRDQIVQQMIVQVLRRTHTRAIWHRNSYAYSYNEGVEEALDAAKGFIHQGCRYAVHFELNDFFNNVPQDAIYDKLWTCIGNQEVIELIMCFLPQDNLASDILVQLGVGSPHGSPLAHYLGSVIYLDELDWYLKKLGCQFVRYEDDLTVFFECQKDARSLRDPIQDFLEQELECPVFRSKAAVIPTATMDIAKVIFQNNLWHLQSARQAAVDVAKKQLETAVKQQLLCA